MKKKIGLIIVFSMIVGLLASLALATPLLDNDMLNEIVEIESNNIGFELPGGYEPSGAVWNPLQEKLYIVSDDGEISSMDSNGENLENFYVGGDLEGVTITKPRRDYLYVLVESPDTIKEFSLETESFTGKQWTLTSWLHGSDNQGAEAITWIPKRHHNFDVSGGVFAVGLQEDGKVYFFSVDLRSSESVEYLDSMNIEFEGRTIGSDISGMQYNRVSRTLFVIADSYNSLVGLQLDRDSGEWEEVAEYSLPGNNQEGITFMLNGDDATGSMFVAEDDEELYRYDVSIVDNIIEEYVLDWFESLTGHRR